MKTLTHKMEMRGTFDGVGQIVRFNWPRYAIAMAGMALACFGYSRLPVWEARSVATAALASFWGMTCSVVVSWWVYDASPLMRWDWLKMELAHPPVRWLNVHAGLDESTLHLRRLWPAAAGETVDIFSQREMTEASIIRARSRGIPAARKVDYRALPFVDAHFDKVFVLFAAHELREPVGRRILLGELRRVMAPAGELVLVEHLRDAANFIAFGPGFLHFHSRQSWLDDLNAAGLRVERERRFTPFVGVFILRTAP